MTQNERRVPVEAQAFALLDRTRPERGALVGAEIDPGEGAALALGVDLIGIMGIDAADEAVAAADREPILVDGAGGGAGAAWAAPAAVVLQAAVDLVVEPAIDRDVVELPERGGIEMVPVGAAVVAGVEAAVAADDDVLAIL